MYCLDRSDVLSGWSADEGRDVQTVHAYCLDRSDVLSGWSADGGGDVQQRGGGPSLQRVPRSHRTKERKTKIINICGFTVFLSSMQRSLLVRKLLLVHFFILLLLN